MSSTEISAETERVRHLQDKSADSYDRRIAFFERVLFGGGREWACGQAGGEVLEVAVGTARNLPFYSPEAKLTAIELSPEMLAIGKRRAEELGREADLRLGDAQKLEFGDESFDCIVCTLSLCTIPEPRLALAEAYRVLRSGGRLFLLEHVRSPRLGVRAVQHLINPLSIRFQGDHLTREPLDHLEPVGFEIEGFERAKLGILERVVARKPA